MDGHWMPGHHRFKNGRRDHDPLEHIAVGDPDPSPANGHPQCEFEWAEQRSPLLILQWSCTREPGHQGQHLAGTGEKIAALHPAARRSGHWINPSDALCHGADQLDLTATTTYT